MGHAYTNLLVHLVFATKERLPLLDAALRPRLCAYIGGILRESGGRLLAANGMADHTHILAVLKPNAAVSESVREIKANSSRWLRRDCGLGNRFGWQGGYGAFSVSKSQVERVRKYIEGQERHHARQTFEDELVGLLRAHGIAFEERYLWD